MSNKTVRTDPEPSAPEPARLAMPRQASSAIKVAARIEELLEPFSGDDIGRILGWVSASFRNRLFPPTTAFGASPKEKPESPE